MAEPIEEFDTDEEQLLESPDPKFIAAISALKERCSRASIEIEESTEDEGHSVVIRMPAGREKRLIRIFGFESAQTLLSCTFEKLVFLADYDAFCSYEDGFIEAAVSSIGPTMHLLRRRLFGVSMTGNIDPANYAIQIEPSDDKSTVRARLRLGGHRLAEIQSRSGPSLEITGLSISNHD
jgi:hypothetical protein